ncbi:hypothetical protein BC830DRAFT_1044602, partial [Chytriomyces sp. MP71]
EHAGRVAGCNINPVKLSAFVKMYTREEAATAHRVMNHVPVDGALLRVSANMFWGCGFGPKEHFKYDTGETLFPIAEMSDADKKSIQEAKYGGGPIQGSVLVEEPDI